MDELRRQPMRSMIGQEPFVTEQQRRDRRGDDFRTMGTLCGGYGGVVPATAPLKRLVLKGMFPAERGDRLIAAYRLLGDRIRNRDSHMYQHGVRDQDFPLVASVFVPALNELIWL